LGAAREENKELLSKLIVSERDRKSALVGLKSAETQAKDQCKLLYQIEIELATSRQLVLDLRAELQRAKEVAQLAKEAVKAKKQAAYNLGVKETQARLIEELAEACRDYCDATWAEALNIAGVPADSEWRQLGKTYYHPDIREILGGLPSPSATTLESLEQPLTTQATLPLLVASKGSNQAGDQGQRVEGAKDKGKGKEKKSSSEAKDAAKDKEAAAKTKEAKAETIEANPKAKDTSTSQSSQKEDPPAPKATKA